MTLTGRDLAALAGQESILVIRRPFVAWLGGLPEALLLDQCLYWQDAAGPGVWWSRSDSDMAGRLCLSVYAVAKARAALAAWLSAERRGIPARMWYCLDVDAVAAAFADHVASNRAASSANSRNLSDGSAEHSIREVKEGKTLKNIPNGMAGAGSEAVADKPAKRQRKPKAPAAGAADQRALFGDLCRAAGWHSADLTPGNRVQLAKLAARILAEPEADRPGADDLVSIYDRRCRELAGQLRRPVSSLGVSQFRQAIGAWIHARQAERAGAAEAAEAAAAADALRRLESEAARAPAALAWGQAKAAIVREIPAATFGQWFAGAAPVGLAGDVLTVRVMSEQAQDWIQSRLGDVLTKAAAAAGIGRVQIVAYR